jgi:uncharacterized Zn-binding protein involved in type VI secretion
MPPAARVADMHTCPMVTGVVPHVGGPILPPCCPTVLIGGLPAARVTDLATCAGPPDTIVKGSPTVLINGLMAARMGDLTAHGGVIILGLPTVMIGDVATPFPAAAVSLAEAQLVFDLIASQGDIAFKYPADGCYARAHIMVQRMVTMGLTPGKVWSFSADKVNDPLWVATPNDPSGTVSWSYHVAPTLPVGQPDGTVSNMVVDPSMFDHPVPVEKWQNAQHDHPVTATTKPGEAPPGRPGSGYWPGPDPPEGPDRHARKIMREYKSREGGP